MTENKVVNRAFLRTVLKNLVKIVTDTGLNEDEILDKVFKKFKGAEITDSSQENTPVDIAFNLPYSYKPTMDELKKYSNFDGNVKYLENIEPLFFTVYITVTEDGKANIDTSFWCQAYYEYDEENVNFSLDLGINKEFTIDNQNTDTEDSNNAEEGKKEGGNRMATVKKVNYGNTKKSSVIPIEANSDAVLDQINTADMVDARDLKQMFLEHGFDPYFSNPTHISGTFRAGEFFISITAEWDNGSDDTIDLYIQANGTGPRVVEWLSYLESKGFDEEGGLELNDVKPTLRELSNILKAYKAVAIQFNTKFGGDFQADGSEQKGAEKTSEPQPKPSDEHENSDNNVIKDIQGRIKVSLVDKKYKVTIDGDPYISSTREDVTIKAIFRAMRKIGVFESPVTTLNGLEYDIITFKDKFYAKVYNNGKKVSPNNDNWSDDKDPISIGWGNERDLKASIKDLINHINKEHGVKVSDNWSFSNKASNDTVKKVTSVDDNIINGKNDDPLKQYKISEDIIKRENSVSMFRRNDTDHNKDLYKHLEFYKKQVDEIIADSKYEDINNTLQGKFDKFCRDYTDAMSKYLNHRANNPSWAVTGRSGMNVRKYNKAQDRQDALLARISEVDEYINKAINNAKSAVKSAKLVDEKKEREELLANTELPKFPPIQINIPGDGLKRGVGLQGYAIVKNWGCFRIYTPSGRELHSMKTNETQKAAKEWLFHYLTKKGLLNDAQEASTEPKKMKKTATKVIREDGDFRLIERDGLFTIQNHSTGKWLVYKESYFGSFSKLEENRAKDYYATIMLLGSYSTFKRHQMSNDEFLKKRQELFGNKETVKTDNDVKTENPQPKDLEENLSYRDLLKKVTGLNADVNENGIITVALKDNDISKKLRISRNLMMAIVGIPWQDDTASFNIFCKDSELFSRLKEHGFTMTVAKQNSDKEFMFNMKVNHNQGGWDGDAKNITENLIREFWDKCLKAGATAHQLLTAYKSASIAKGDLFHLSPRENEDAILKDGLLSTLAGNRTGDAVPGAVYVTTDVDAIVNAMANFKKGEFTVFKVKGNHKLNPDFYEPSLAGTSFYIRDSIDPQDLQKVGYVIDGVRTTDIEDDNDNVPTDLEVLIDDINRIKDVDNLVFQIDGNSIDIEFKELDGIITTINAKDYGIDISNLDDKIKEIKGAIPDLKIFKDNHNKNNLKSLKDLITADELEAQLYDVKEVIEDHEKFQIVYEDDENIRAFMNIYFTKNMGDINVHLKIIDRLKTDPKFNDLQCLNKSSKNTLFRDVNGSTISRKQYLFDKLEDGPSPIIGTIRSDWRNFKEAVDKVKVFVQDDLEMLKKDVDEVTKKEDSLEDIVTRIVGLKPSTVTGSGAVQFDSIPTGSNLFNAKMKVSTKKVIASFHFDMAPDDVNLIISSETDAIMKALGFVRRNGTKFFLDMNIKDLEKDLQNVWEDFNNALSLLTDAVKDATTMKPKQVEPEFRDFEYNIETDGCSLYLKGTTSSLDGKSTIDQMVIKDEKGITVSSCFGVNSYLSMVQDREEDLRYVLKHGRWSPVAEFVEKGRLNTVLQAKKSIEVELKEAKKAKYWEDIRKKIDIAQRGVMAGLHGLNGGFMAINGIGDTIRVLIPNAPLGTQTNIQVQNILQGSFGSTVSKVQEELARFGTVREFKGVASADQPDSRPYDVSTEKLDALNQVMAFINSERTPSEKPKEVESKPVDEVVKNTNSMEVGTEFLDTQIEGVTAVKTIIAVPRSKKHDVNVRIELPVSTNKFGVMALNSITNLGFKADGITLLLSKRVDNLELHVPRIMESYRNALNTIKEELLLVQEREKNKFGVYKDTAIYNEFVQSAIAPMAGGSRMYRLSVLDTKNKKLIEDFFIAKGYYKNADGFLYKEVFTHDDSENYNLIKAMDELKSLISKENDKVTETPKDDKENLHAMKVAELKQILKDLGVENPKGVKAVLIGQIEELRKGNLDKDSVNKFNNPKGEEKPKQQTVKELKQALKDLGVINPKGVKAVLQQQLQDIQSGKLSIEDANKTNSQAGWVPKDDWTPTAETTAKLSMVSDESQKEQLKKLQVIARKFAKEVDADPNINIFFLEEPRELKKYKLPTVALAMVNYDMSLSRAELMQNVVFKRFKKARGTVGLGNWFPTEDSAGRPCKMCLFLDKDFEKASDDNRKLVSKLYHKYKVVESVGEFINVCGEQMLLESYNLDEAVFKYNNETYVMDDKDMVITETTQCDGLSIDTKKDDMTKKALRKLKLRKKD